MESLVIGAIASLGAGFATVIGALPVLLTMNYVGVWRRSYVSGNIISALLCKILF